MKELVLIKLGGSVITDKTTPRTLRSEVLQRLVSEIARAQRELPDVLFIVGHGHGSFGHVPALEYRTKEGFVTEKSRWGMTLVLDEVQYLHRIVTHAFIEEGLPVASFRLAQTATTRNGKLESSFLPVLERYLSEDIIPITCGDVLVDSQKGCSIWSTEEVLSCIANELRSQWSIRNIMHVTDVEGVLNEQGALVTHISQHDWEHLKPALGKAKGFDMSGGMLLKVEESIKLANTGLPTLILSGLAENNVYNALTNHDWIGTHIS